MLEFFFIISIIFGLFLVGAFLNTLFGEDSVFDIIDTRLFYRLFILALLCHGIYLGYSIHTHFHSIEDSLQKIENAMASEKKLQNRTNQKSE